MVHRWCRPFVVGRPEIFAVPSSYGKTTCEVVQIDSAEAGGTFAGSDPVWLAAGTRSWRFAPGKLDARAGQAAYTPWWPPPTGVGRSGRCDHHGAVAQGGVAWRGADYPGHTELLAEMCGVADFAMMLYLGPEAGLGSPGGLAVVHVTLHTALRNVLDELSEDAIFAKERLADRFMAAAERHAAADRGLWR